MSDIEEVSIDVRDVDYSWFEGVKAYLDRDFDRYYFPRESRERLGELDPDSGDARLLDGLVEAKTYEIDIDGQHFPCWSTGCLVRPASKRVLRGGNGITPG